jgi:hypothetical protein
MLFDKALELDDFVFLLSLLVFQAILLLGFFGIKIFQYSAGGNADQGI